MIKCSFNKQKFFERETGMEMGGGGGGGGVIKEEREYCSKNGKDL